jgi:CelD/BcsL family acetyltransferase involved in cellulose biosynthesis
MTSRTQPFEAEIVRAAALGADDAAVWSAIQRAQPAFRSPLLSPHFARAVGRVRDDARVAVISRGDKKVAFFGFHQRPGGFGRPLGAPFSDYHGVVSVADTGLKPGQIIALSGLKAFRHNGLIDPHSLFPATEDAVEAFAIELKDTPEAYLEAVRAASPKKFKNYRRLAHRLAEIGPLTIRADTSQTAFDDVMAWKSGQFLRTGVQDVLRPAWVADLMQSLFARREGPMTGLLLSLYAGDTLVGGHFGVREGGVYHPWIASMSPEMAAFSPGQTFLDQAIRAMPELGLEVYDLGVGHDHYKRPFAPTTDHVGAGFHSAPGGTLKRAEEAAWTFGPLGRSSAVDKVRRRLDHIATADPSIRGRVHGLLEAVAATRRRSLTGDTSVSGGAGE